MALCCEMSKKLAIEHTPPLEALMPVSSDDIDIVTEYNNYVDVSGHISGTLLYFFHF